MRQVGAIDVHHLGRVFTAVANPWIVVGICCLLAFMASYMTALSFADLTYVLPATAISYVNMAAIAHFWLGEHISLIRWAGIVLIVIGVGVVAGGPPRTEDQSADVADSRAAEERV
jgi:drug/metabolite transporter (DMT)-like permease